MSDDCFCINANDSHECHLKRNEAAYWHMQLCRAESDCPPDAVLLDRIRDMNSRYENIRAQKQALLERIERLRLGILNLGRIETLNDLAVAVTDLLESDDPVLTPKKCGMSETNLNTSGEVPEILRDLNGLEKENTLLKQRIAKLKARLTNVEYYGCAEDSEEANQGLKDDDELAEGGGK